MSKSITLKPRLSEKTYALAAKLVYVFDVDSGINKHSLARAVEAQFDVKVAEVNTVNQKGKAKRVISVTGKRMLNAEGKRADFKKAYVTLAEGHSLPFFEAIEEEAKQEQETQEKLEKAMDKQMAKKEKRTRGGVLRRKKAEESK